MINHIKTAAASNTSDSESGSGVYNGSCTFPPTPKLKVQACVMKTPTPFFVQKDDTMYPSGQFSHCRKLPLIPTRARSEKSDFSERLI
jgi:hypothetical protein